jgi:hypothetical protein
MFWALVKRNAGLSGLSRLSSLSGRNKAGTRDEGVGKSAAERQRIGKEEPQATPSAGSGWQSRKPQANAAVRQKKPQAASHKPQGDSNEDRRPLIHYVFNQENTYETEFRGKRAVGVRDLGKGEPADLVIPEHFEPYERVFLRWDVNWSQYKANWTDVVVNILGFIPFGALLLLVLGNGKLGIGRRGFGLQDSGFGTKEENPPRSPFMKGGGMEGDSFANGGGPEGGPFMKRGGLVVAVILTVVVGFGVSFAIEYLQAYLPSRDSSLRDLVCNTVGTATGAIAAAWMVGRRSILVTGDESKGPGTRV